MAVPVSRPLASSIEASHPVTTHSRNAMCASISRSDGQELDGENDRAKITASPVRRVAKNARLNWTESITSWRASGFVTAMMSRATAQAASAARRGLCRTPRIHAVAGAAQRTVRIHAAAAISSISSAGDAWSVIVDLNDGPVSGKELVGAAGLGD